MKKISTYMGGGLSAVGGATVEEVEQFAQKVARKKGLGASFVPHGYVVRLPTCMEWMYAFSSGGNTDDGDYSRVASGLPAENAEEVEVVCSGPFYNWNYVKNLQFSTDIPKTIQRIWPMLSPRYKVKTLRPNSWGFYDMAGLCKELIFDVTDPLPDWVSPWTPRGLTLVHSRLVAMCEKDKQDPFLMSQVADARNMFVSVAMKDGRFVKECFGKGHQSGWNIGFRLVFGPDLVAEKKAAAAKKR